DPPRLRPPVAAKPLELRLREPPLTRRSVDDLELFGLARDGPQQPVAPLLRLVLVAGGEQGVQGERRVAEPAVPVVPVPNASELLGEGRRGGRDDPAGRRVRQRLERDR